jgi:CheY-like chemotaxis protein
MGLGLSICKNLIELMNGSIDVKSTENLGSSFIFTIRLPEYTTITSIDESHYKTLIGKTAIIIDDNKTNLKFIEQTLIKCKMPLTTCDSSIDSLEYFKNTVPFDFIILDICLPNMDGCELSNKIRNEYKYTCPIIGISSINQDQLDKNIYNHYFDVILTKPIQSIELISTILMLLSEKPKLPQTVPPTRRPTKKNTRTILSDSECTLNNSQKKHTAYLTPRNSIDCSDDELPQHLTQRSISSHNVYNPLYQQSSSHTNIIDLEILLVEDNEINAQITFDQFNSFGVNKIDHAINGTCGFDMAKNKLYDVIFMDISMPGMDGIECSEKILEFYKNKNTKTPYIIALTANTMTETLAAAKNSGMKKILLKPVKIDDFKNTLISFLRKFP